MLLRSDIEGADIFGMQRGGAAGHSDHCGSTKGVKVHCLRPEGLPKGGLGFMKAQLHLEGAAGDHVATLHAGISACSGEVILWAMQGLRSPASSWDTHTKILCWDHGAGLHAFHAVIMCFGGVAA